MNGFHRVILAVAATALLAGPAFAQQTGTTGAAPAATGMPSTSGTGPAGSASMGHGPADHAFIEEMRTMQQQMSAYTMTGNPDKDFVGMMIPHHQGAIAMAKTELKYGKSPYLKRMARKIVKSQSREIKKMTKWQEKHPNQ